MKPPRSGYRDTVNTESSRNAQNTRANVKRTQPKLIVVSDADLGSYFTQVKSTALDVRKTPRKPNTSVLKHILHLRTGTAYNMKKSDASKIPALKGIKKGLPKSPSLPKKHCSSSPENVSSGSQSKLRSGTSNPGSGASSLSVPSTEEQHQMVRSTDDLESVEVSSRENGSSGEGGLDDLDTTMPSDVHVHDPAKRISAIDQLQSKIVKTMEHIKAEQAAKEENVNEYLQLAASADKQQLQRIKTVFEKKNQKSTQSISHLQKKLENYHKRVNDIETYGVTGHKQAREVLRDVGQGLKFWKSPSTLFTIKGKPPEHQERGVGANIVDGITGFSGGVVDNIKGAKDTIVSKPKEFAHLIKNKFGSADNISQMKSIEECQTSEPEKCVSTLPASFKYSSDDDNSSITSGSGFGAHSSPLSASQATSQQLPTVTQANLEPLIHELTDLKDKNAKIHDTLQRLLEEFDNYKSSMQNDVGLLKTYLDEERYRVERLEEQINDMTELHQNEVTNLRQDISSMEEKIEYRLDERTSDIHDLLENCQTRVSKMELQQQQQQIISMEMVENVTFRTLLTKLINVVLALLAVILVFVSTAANLVAPFLTTRARILSTSLFIVILVLIVQNWSSLNSWLLSVWDYIVSILPER